MKYIFSVLSFLLAMQGAYAQEIDTFGIINYTTVPMSSTGSGITNNTQVKWGPDSPPSSIAQCGAYGTDTCWSTPVQIYSYCQSGQTWVEKPTLHITPTSGVSGTCTIQINVSCNNGATTWANGPFGCTGDFNMTYDSNKKAFNINPNQSK